MIINAIQETTALLPSMNYFTDGVSQLLYNLPVNWAVLAQTVTDPDVLGRMQKTFNHFVETGQLWALLIGIVIGYMIRNLTSYG